MSNGRGIIVQFTDKNGIIQKGISYYSDQRDSFSNYGRTFIRLTNSDGSPMKDENGKNVCALKLVKDIKQIGFVD